MSILKRTTGVLLSGLMVIGGMSVMTTAASALESGNYSYDVKDGEAEIIGYDGKEKEIVIPEEIDGYKVTAIGDYVFSYRTEVSEVKLPESLEEIGTEAFRNTSVKRIDIPDSVKKIGEEAFFECENLSEVKLPEGLKEIRYGTFESTAIKRIEIPDSVEKIGERAFWYCRNLSKVKFSKSLKEIGNEAFEYTALKRIDIPDSVKKIGYKAFLGCVSSFKVSGKNKYYSSKDGVLYNKKQDKIIAYPYYKPDPEFTVDKKVRTIVEYAFYGNKKLSKVTFKKGLKTIENYAFSGSGIKKLRLPASLKKIGEFTFSSCEKLKSVYIPTSVTSIEWCAFAYDKSLTKIDFKGNPKLVTGTDVFGGCHSLKKVSIPQTNGSCGRLFDSCFGLKTVIISDKIKKFDAQMFTDCRKFASFKVSGKNKYFSSKDGVLYNKKQDKIIACPTGKSGTFTVNKKVRGIGAYAFLGSKKLSKVTFKKGVKTIGECAFCGSGIKKLRLPSSLKKIGKEAFSSCEKLKSVYIPTSVTSIGSYAFYVDESLTKLDFKGNSKLVMGSDVFTACHSLKKVSIPQTKKCKGYMFFRCGSLKTVKVSSKIKTIYTSDFDGCDELKSITIPKNVKKIENKALGWHSYEDDEDEEYFGVPTKFVIRGYKNSAAHKYAKERGIEFVKIG